MKIILAAVVALAPLAVHAEDDKCAQLGGLAATIMTKRQEGVPMSSLMNVDIAEDMRAIATAMIIGAYGMPRMSSEAGKLRSVQDYRNAFELDCYKTEAEAEGG